MTQYVIREHKLPWRLSNATATCSSADDKFRLVSNEENAEYAPSEQVNDRYSECVLTCIDRGERIKPGCRTEDVKLSIADAEQSFPCIELIELDSRVIDVDGIPMGRYKYGTPPI